MKFWIRRLHGNERAQAPPAPTPWRYSDTAYLVAGISGTVGAAFGGSGVTGIVSTHAALVVAFFAGLLTTVLLGVGKYLQSKGD